MTMSGLVLKLWGAPRYIWGRTLRSALVPWAENRFATHLPVLIGVGILTRPRHVLELGSGKFSTPVLADRAIFPTVKELHSVEDDAEWAESVKANVAGQAHVQVVETASVPELVNRIDLDRYDLIFIDDSALVEDRVRTINTILRRCSPRSTVVIHDFEWRAYRRAVPLNWHRSSMQIWRPLTGVIWRDGLTRERVKGLTSALAAGRNISPDDARKWREHLQRELGPVRGAGWV